DLPVFIEKIKEMGYLVKLDTNGCRPAVLKELLDKGLLDYVAMDIKNTKERYAMTVGRKSLDIGCIEESVEILKESSIAYEFRTTVVRELHRKEDFAAIGEWLAGAKAYFLQAYQDNENVIAGGFTAYDKEEMEEFAQIVRNNIARVELRGIG
ncbi:MAG: anaerobic ribonucleoside-triphosphate reductase activating protein, partial [Lachnospiraceae bacterium]|nr:anaerobic ribonucleoside-triphosphate reductase activating protein [Lachnospiraceae bacterium]